MSTCRSCGAEIVWAKSEAGRAMPFDAKPETRWTLSRDRTDERIARTVPTFVSHFATCPNADLHRSKAFTPEQIEEIEDSLR
jgi:hypothetical protein